jgi:hypothetical protein
MTTVTEYDQGAGLPAAARASLGTLSAGALGWLESNLAFFMPFGRDSTASPLKRAKAALELALLCHCAGRLPAGGDRLSGATELVRTLWQRTDFLELITAHPVHGRQYGLIYAALAPDGIDDSLPRAVLARLAASDHLSSLGPASYPRMETRFYADKAGLAHEIEPFAELAERSFLTGRHATLPVAKGEAYNITHTCFYLSDYGFRDTCLAGEARERTQDLARRLLDHCVREELWDLTAELIISLFGLGADPAGTPSAVAGLRSLVRAQGADGAIPGRSQAQRAAASATAEEFFWNSYHTTLVAALMSLIVSAGRRYRPSAGR